MRGMGAESLAFVDAKILNCSEPEYREHPGLSYSQWKYWDSPEFFEGAFVRKPPIYEIDETADMLFGTNVHAEFLEGKECHQVPDWALTSDGKRYGKKWDAFKAGHPAIDCLSAKEIVTVQGLRASIESQPKIANLLWGEGESEVKIAALHNDTTIPVRGMLDKVRRTGTDYLIADMKVSAIDPCHRFGVSKRIWDFRYYMQAACYVDLATAVYGKPPLDYLFVWCHKEPPYLVRAMPLEPAAIELGRRHNDEALKEISRRHFVGDWTGEGHNDVQETVIDIPDWAYKAEQPTFRDFIGDYQWAAK